MSKIIHLGRNGSIMNSFVKFVDENFDNKRHFFYLSGKDINNKNNVIDIKNKFDFIKNIIRLNFDLYKSEKIIIHGFNQSYLFYLFFFQPWLLKKLYWIMWGGDLYSYLLEANSLKIKIIYFMRNVIFKNLEYFVTYIKGDYELAQKWYGAKGEYYECFMYPSNLYKEYDIKPKEHDAINIQLGNSADPSNNHIYILKKLVKYKDENIQLFIPLSYGNEEYAKKVIAYGKELFGDKFVPLTEFMPFEKYLEFLGEIDIAIFAHKRQQAMGNTITLLGLGKKVYMRSNITPWQLFKDIDVKVFDVDDIKINLIDEQTQKENQEKIKEYFSKENYLNQLKNLFESK
ncbi:TDP-N-acetylfucosamine:lipid II N-acetylfucosaminyltransferase [Aliarcobacter butzleri]|uniref:TDP-N-acetylfucosamine:lipid II N-acetylfucosaminyltransferase n=1 Tax=Aliarcobacter butzleri TaxID=28197 RepID=UPI0021B355B1|nr:TDP-N-acetylfucosamine:lipid II N-acetylfucosaminyltransferase [Aliarcobacter butzleri]MCT7586743.1 TDP-N-acetylfucosamine:lipid II N-acetylfucosaminyltransferase [Aliarcobacter butzleri]